MEAMVYDDAGQLRSGTLVDYLLPTTMDMPSMEIEHIQSPSTAR
jgi:aerobic carbon-monoxide dehydrogenase large subunit